MRADPQRPPTDAGILSVVGRSAPGAPAGANSAPVLRAGVVASGLGIRDLWIRCFGLGATLDEAGLRAILGGELAGTAYEHNLIAQALNECFLDRDLPPAVVYSEGLEHPPGRA